VCHGKEVGDIGSYRNRALSRDIVVKYGTPPKGDVRAMKALYTLYAMDPANGAVVAALKAGVDPEDGSSLCGATYGCGAHVAKKAPPTDFSAPLWVIGAVVAGGLLRRRRSPRVA
jgi:MYXO-CTERM domain-containing protein